MKRLICGVLLALIVSNFGFAEPTNQLYRLAPNQESRHPESLEAFLGSVQKLLPQTLVDHILGTKGPITVRFKAFPTHKTFALYLPLPSCGKEDSSMPREQIYGSYSPYSHEIVLNDLWLWDIDRPSLPNRTFPCGHKTMHRLALATLIHETVHAYDFSQKSAVALSKNKTFLHLLRWHRREGKLINLQRNKQRSPDPYEFINPEESLAVNLEHFFLDPTYPQRRPNLAKFFGEHFGILVPDAPLFTSLPKFRTEAEPLVLEPSQIERASYLMASPGKGLESGFGHSMLRLEGCRVPHGDHPCPQGERVDLVANFSARRDESKVLNPIKGIFGGYPSVVTLLTFGEAYEKYSIQEDRRLVTYPLILDRKTRESLVTFILQSFWEYSGDYTFAKQNCTTEARYVLQAVIPSEALAKEHPVTPSQLAQALIRDGLVDKAKIEERLSLLEITAGRFVQWDSQTWPSATTASKWVVTQLGLPPKERRRTYESYLGHGRSPAMLEAFLMLEEHALEQNTQRQVLLRNKELLDFFGDRQDWQIAKALLKDPCQDPYRYGIPIRCDLGKLAQKFKDLVTEFESRGLTAEAEQVLKDRSDMEANLELLKAEVEKDILDFNHI